MQRYHTFLCGYSLALSILLPVFAQAEVPRAEAPATHMAATALMMLMLREEWPALQNQNIETLTGEPDIRLLTIHGQISKKQSKGFGGTLEVRNSGELDKAQVQIEVTKDWLEHSDKRFLLPKPQYWEKHADVPNQAVCKDLYVTCALLRKSGTEMHLACSGSMPLEQFLARLHAPADQSAPEMLPREQEALKSSSR